MVSYYKTHAPGFADRDYFNKTGGEASETYADHLSSRDKNPEKWATPTHKGYKSLALD